MPSFLNPEPSSKKKEETQLPNSPPKNLVRPVSPLPSSPSKNVGFLKNTTVQPTPINVPSSQKNSSGELIDLPSSPKSDESVPPVSHSTLRNYSKTVAEFKVQNGSTVPASNPSGPPRPLRKLSSEDQITRTVPILKSSVSTSALTNHSRPVAIPLKSTTPPPSQKKSSEGTFASSPPTSAPPRSYGYTVSSIPDSKAQNNQSKNNSSSNQRSVYDDVPIKTIPPPRKTSSSSSSPNRTPASSKPPAPTVHFQLDDQANNSSPSPSSPKMSRNQSEDQKKQQSQQIFKSESFTGRAAWALPPGPTGQRRPTKLPIPAKSVEVVVDEKPARPPRPVVKATGVFVATVAEELSLKENDTVILKEADENGWGRGFLESDLSKEGWFPLQRVLYQNDTAMQMIVAAGEKRCSVQVESMVNETNIKTLEQRISLRPSKETLEQNNILVKTSASPALQNSTQLLDKSQKGDFLTNFFRRAQALPGSPLKLSKTVLDFKEVEVGVTVTDTIEVTSSIKTKFNFEIGPGTKNTVPSNIHLTFDPLRGIFQKNKSTSIKISLLLKSTTNISQLVIPISEGEGSKATQTPFTLKFECKKGVFGSDPLTLPQKLDEEYGLTVPSVLISLKDKLKSSGDGIKREGIFRISGETNAILTAKRAINDNKPIDNADIHTISNLIKLWFRELPEGILQSLSAKQLECDDPEECVESLSSLSKYQKSLLEWVIKLIRDIVRHADSNKMTADNMSIVFAPNLYKISELDPVSGLAVTQNLAKFFTIIVSAYNNPSPLPIQSPSKIPIPVKTTNSFIEATEKSAQAQNACPVRPDRKSPKSTTDLPEYSIRSPVDHEELPEQHPELDEVQRSAPPNRPLPFTRTKPGAPSIIGRPALSTK